MGSKAEYIRDEAIAEAIHARIVAGVYDDPQGESTEPDEEGTADGK